MNILSWLRPFFPKRTTATGPDIPFGRFTDAYKSENQSRAFKEATQAFERDAYMDAYRAFFQYLKDEQVDNLTVEEKDDALHFAFWQGSQLVTGQANAQKFRAVSQIAKAEDLKVSFMRRLMEANFSLKFSRFSLDADNNICIVFDSFAIDAEPNKLKFALRELAIHADKQDDLMLDEFRFLKPVREREFGDIPEAEKEAKYAYLVKEINAAIALHDRAVPDPNRFPGHYAFLYLALAFKLDYLIKPEGVMMDTLERVYGIYFAQNNQTSQAKVQNIRREFEKLLAREKADFFKEMYRTRSTFGINPQVNHVAVASLIEGKLNNMDKPIQDGHNELALSVGQYIAGFALFHHAPPQPDRELLHLLFQVTEAAYFRSLGFRIPYEQDGKLDPVSIKAAIGEVEQRNRSQYGPLNADLKSLDFESDTLFVKSFLWMVQKLNLKEAS
jgi:hypothetical protein